MYPVCAHRGCPPNKPLPLMMLSPQRIPQPIMSPILCWQPMEQATDSSLEQTMLQIVHGYWPGNLNTIYNAKTAEFLRCCCSLYPNDPHATILLNCYKKVYGFIFYQGMRGQADSSRSGFLGGIAKMGGAILGAMI